MEKVAMFNGKRAFGRYRYKIVRHGHLRLYKQKRKEIAALGSKEAAGGGDDYA